MPGFRFDGMGTKQRVYWERALAFMGAEATRGSTFELREGTSQWRKWRQYFERHLGFMPKGMLMLARGQIGCFLVPTEWPDEFDPLFSYDQARDPPRPAAPSPQEQARVSGKFDKLLGTMRMRSMNEAEREKARAEATRRSAETSQRMIEAEYRRLGIEPVTSNGLTVSLAMLRRQGWTVEEVGGARVLVAPARMAAQVEGRKSWEE